MGYSTDAIQLWLQDVRKDWCDEERNFVFPRLTIDHEGYTTIETVFLGETICETGFGPERACADFIAKMQTLKSQERMIKEAIATIRNLTGKPSLEYMLKEIEEALL